MLIRVSITSVETQLKLVYIRRKCFNSHYRKTRSSRASERVDLVALGHHQGDLRMCISLLYLSQQGQFILRLVSQ